MKLGKFVFQAFEDRQVLWLARHNTGDDFESVTQPFLIDTHACEVTRSLFPQALATGDRPGTGHKCQQFLQSGECV